MKPYMVMMGIHSLIPYKGPASFSEETPSMLRFDLQQSMEVLLMGHLQDTDSYTSLCRSDLVGFPWKLADDPK